MKIPSNMMIRGFKWTIKMVDQPFDESGQPTSGTACAYTRVIEIEEGIGPDLTLETFIHEYGHAVCFELGIDDEDIPSWIEHMIVIGISKDMVSNKKIFKKLF